MSKKVIIALITVAILILVFIKINSNKDNAAIIVYAGYFNYIKENTHDLDLNAVPNLKID